MSKPVKVIATAAAALFAIGLLIAFVAFAFGAPTNYYWDNGLRAQAHSGRNAQQTEPRINPTTAFTGMDLETDDYEVMFERTTGEYGVSYVNFVNDPDPTIYVENGVLTVDTNRSDDDNIPDFSLFGFGHRRGSNMRTLTVRFPQGAKLTELSLDSDLSDLTLADLAADRINLDIALGAIDLSNVQAKRLELDAALGDVNLYDCVIDSADLTLKMGSFTARNLETKGMTLDAKMGSVDLDGAFYGKTTIDAKMGSVGVVTRVDPMTCYVSTRAKMGDSSVRGGGSSDSNSPNRLDIDVSMGTIDVTFDR